MRRKMSPSALARHSRSRPLAPARTASFLPTAASLALALGCSTPSLDGIVADPATTKSAQQAVSAAPPIASSSGYIEPEPYDVDGEVTYVKPASKKPVSKPKP